MTENKFEIANKLLKTLQSTREYRDLRDLIYIIREDNEEIIKATFENGYTKDICVNADSGIALIRDVLRGLA